MPGEGGGVRVERLANGFRVAGAHTGTTGPVLLQPGPAEEMLLVSTGDGGMRRWAVASGEVLWRQPARGGWAMDFASVFDSRGTWVLAAASEEGICRFDVRTGAELGRGLWGPSLWGVAGACLSDGRAVFVGAGNDGVHRWDAITGELVGALLLSGGIGRSAAAGVLCDGTPIVVCGTEGRGVHLWHLGTGESLGVLRAASPWDFTQVATLRLDGGRTLVAASDLHEGVVCRWDADSAEPIGEPVRAGAGVVMLSAVRLAGEPVLIASGEDGVVGRWHAVTGRLLDASAAGVAAACAVRVDGTVLLATGTREGDLALQSLGTSEAADGLL